MLEGDLTSGAGVVAGGREGVAIGGGDLILLALVGDGGNAVLATGDCGGGSSLLGLLALLIFGGEETGWGVGEATFGATTLGDSRGCLGVECEGGELVVMVTPIFPLSLLNTSAFLLAAGLGGVGAGGGGGSSSSIVGGSASTVSSSRSSRFLSVSFSSTCSSVAVFSGSVACSSGAGCSSGSGIFDSVGCSSWFAGSSIFSSMTSFSFSTGGGGD